MNEYVSVTSEKLDITDRISGITKTHFIMGKVILSQNHLIERYDKNNVFAKMYFGIPLRNLTPPEISTFTVLLHH